MAETRRVVVTGLGVVSPVGSTLDAFWAAIQAGESGVGPITYFDAAAFDTRFAGQVKGFQVEDFISKKEARRMDPFCHYGVAAAKMAMDDSGLDMSQQDPHRIGVVAASGVGGLQVLQTQMDVLRTRGPRRFSPFMIPQMITNILPGLISINHNLKGPNFAVVTACATGTHCIGESLALIRSNQADVMVAGGAEGAICELGVGGFNAMRALSTRNDSPETASRPFDKDRDGFIMAEGAGMLVIEEYEHARARGARIYCEVAGFGCTGDAYHITAPDASAEGPARGMQLALEDASLTPADIDYINAHGTSTVLNDSGETKAIKLALGEDRARQIAVSSTKSMTGHLLGAAGGVESAVCVLAIRDGVLPPTINYTTPDPNCDLDYVPNEARQAPIRACLNNSLGFGGHNGTLCFKAL
ncbi:MAG: beta-ketoacyl-ACP synthase II [Kiritimatiellae bacterium]|nr:beta-ketoacyl-ACP synthase II [Kiritimatiellia bacterium]